MAISKEEFKKLASQKILVIDGAMGTMIQRYKLEEKDYRGERFISWQYDIKGNNDLLNLTRPEVIEDIHMEYLEAGADIIETNTFNAQAISLEDYHMADLAYEINLEAARIAKRAAHKYMEANPQAGPKLVAGAIGPTNRTLSISPDVNNPGYRAVSFDEVAQAYQTQIEGLMDGGADLLLIETIFDTLNAKAAVYAAQEYEKRHQIPPIPIMISGTITDASGRTLSGQTLEAFYISLHHALPVSFGFNCALGAKEMEPHIRELSEIANMAVSAYPNAGLPNAMGDYDELPHQTATIIQSWADHGYLNIVGGCCGTTPAHIKAIAQSVKTKTPRQYA